MPQKMRIRDKRYFGPSARSVASKRKTDHAFKRGLAQGQKGRSIATNPYAPGLEHDAWVKGYAQALQYTHRPVPNNAPEGRYSGGTFLYSPVVVKRKGAQKSLPGTPEPVDIFKDTKEFNRYQKQNTYLGYTKPGKDGRIRRFFPLSSNPKEEDFTDKIAGRSDDISITEIYRWKRRKLKKKVSANE
jgi:ribosome modulation factor